MTNFSPVNQKIGPVAALFAKNYKKVIFPFLKSIEPVGLVFKPFGIFKSLSVNLPLSQTNTSSLSKESGISLFP
jgi:hypothetical protein